MDKTTILSPDELLIFWRKGWPEYVIRPIDDYPSIISFTKECAHEARVDIYSVEGYDRICLGLTKVAKFCRDTDPYFKKNLHFFNRAFQTIIHEMQAVKRLGKLQEEQDRVHNYYVNDQRRRKENIRLLEESRLASLKWHNENWTYKDQEEYDKWKICHGIK